jgi:CDP-4-dehydro-6-deoxyglucose reductase, E1
MILLTGGSGLLGQELQKHLDCYAPSHADFDVTAPDLELPDDIDLIVHAAGYTDLVAAERNKAGCYRTNVLGTLNVARLGVPVIYISTEYVFDGKKGLYREDDTPNPVNYYALTKLLGEMAVRTAPRSLVVRCTFKPRPWEHPKAFVDMWTSGDYVDAIAPMLAKVIARHHCFGPHDTIHIGTGRKSVVELARSTRDVETDLREIAPVTLPTDTSLDTSKYDELFGEKKTDIDFARAIFGDEERAAVNRVMAGHWLASGTENAAFEAEFAEYVGVPYALAVNSGSSANLLALASLDLPKGSRVLTSGCGFPATLSPILHLGHKPVLVDYDAGTLNIDVTQAVTAIRHRRCDAVILAHTLGMPVHLRPILDAAEQADIPVIEDCCEAAGATYRGQQVGSLGDIGTFSFYPSHQLTALGGGGMVTFGDEAHYRRAKSLRDWGKLAEWDTYGRTTTTYAAEVDGVAYFPHYVYETVGWNMKLPEANCAFGREQLKRLPGFVEARQQRAKWLAEALPLPRVPVDARPSWFGYPIVLAADVPIGARDRLGDYLEIRGVRHRPFFAGNITRHPPFAEWQQAFPVADYLMTHALFVGCGPHMSETDCRYVAEVVRAGLAQIRHAEAA